MIYQFFVRGMHAEIMKRINKIQKKTSEKEKISVNFVFILENFIKFQFFFCDQIRLKTFQYVQG